MRVTAGACCSGGRPDYRSVRRSGPPKPAPRVRRHALEAVVDTRLLQAIEQFHDVGSGSATPSAPKGASAVSLPCSDPAGTVVGANRDTEWAGCSFAAFASGIDRERRRATPGKRGGQAVSGVTGSIQAAISLTLSEIQIFRKLLSSPFYSQEETRRAVKLTFYRRQAFRVRPVDRAREAKGETARFRSVEVGDMLGADAAVARRKTIALTLASPPAAHAAPSANPLRRFSDRKWPPRRERATRRRRHAPIAATSPIIGPARRERRQSPQ